MISSELLGGGKSREGKSQIVQEQHRLKGEQVQTGQKQIEHEERKKFSSDQRSVALEWGLNTGGLGKALNGFRKDIVQLWQG